MAVELYHRADGDTVRVTFDGSFYSDYVRVSRSQYVYCVDKHGRYAHCNGIVRVVSVTHIEDDIDVWEDTEVTLGMAHPRVHPALYAKIHHLRITL